MTPADFDGDVEVFLVDVEVEAFDGFLELIDADVVGGGDDGPVSGVAVDGGDLVGVGIGRFCIRRLGVGGGRGARRRNSRGVMGISLLCGGSKARWQTAT